MPRRQSSKPKTNTDRSFDMIQRTVFAYPCLASHLPHRSVRRVISQNEQQSKKLDAIQKQSKGRGDLRIPLQRPIKAEHFTGREDELEKVLWLQKRYGDWHLMSIRLHHFRTGLCIMIFIPHRRWKKRLKMYPEALVMNPSHQQWLPPIGH